MTPKRFEDARHTARGQVLPLFALMLTGLLAFTALGLDAANMYLHRRNAQAVADIAAVAGSKALPGNANKARADALAVADDNGYSSEKVTVTTPYGGDNTKIEVVIQTNVLTFFWSVLGTDDVDIGARAVAQHEYSEPFGGYAIFALASNCSSSSEPGLVIDWSGSSNFVNGSVHSQAGARISGSGNTVPAPNTFTYECPGRYSEPGTNAGIPPRATPEECPGPFVNSPCLEDRDPPVFYDPATFNQAPNPLCNWTVSSGDMDLSSGSYSATSDTGNRWWNNSGKTQLRAGKYCAPNGTIKLGDQHVRATDWADRSGVTFFASKVDISGSNANLHPYDRGVLIFATSDQPDAVKLSGSDGTLSGLIYAPNGTVEVSGSTNTTLTGGFVSYRIKFNGSSLNITGTIGAGPGDEGIEQLIE
jgi:hypothetical protein